MTHPDVLVFLLDIGHPLCLQSLSQVPLLNLHLALKTRPRLGTIMRVFVGLPRLIRSIESSILNIYSKGLFSEEARNKKLVLNAQYQTRFRMRLLYILHALHQYVVSIVLSIHISRAVAKSTPD